MVFSHVFRKGRNWYNTAKEETGTIQQRKNSKNHDNRGWTFDMYHN